MFLWLLAYPIVGFVWYLVVPYIPYGVFGHRFEQAFGNRDCYPFFFSALLIITLLGPIFLAIWLYLIIFDLIRGQEWEPGRGWRPRR